MKTRRSLYLKNFVILFIYFVHFSMLSMRSDVVLQQNLQQLTNALDQLQDSLKMQIIFPNEILEIILFKELPKVTNKKEFLEAIKIIKNFILVNTQYYNLIQNEITQKKIIEKLFSSIPASDLRGLKTNLSFSTEPTLLEKINNAAYIMGKLSVGGDSVVELINSNFSPDVIDSEYFLHNAIRVNLPELVQYLINKGADVNKPAGDESPFILAMKNNAPEIALILLKQKNINTSDIAEKLKFRISIPKLPKNGNALTKLLATLLKENIISLENLKKAIQHDPPWPLLTTAIFIYKHSDKKSLKLIKYLLQHNASPLEEYVQAPGGYSATGRKADTPLRDAKGYPELLELFKKYIQD